MICFMDSLVSIGSGFHAVASGPFVGPLVGNLFSTEADAGRDPSFFLGYDDALVDSCLLCLILFGPRGPV